MTSAEVVSRGRVLPRVAARREAVAAALLATAVALSFKLAADAASGPTPALPWTQSGRKPPDFLMGPLAGLGDHLVWWEWHGGLLALCAVWIGALALASAVRTRWAFAAVGAVHLAFVLGPPVGLSDVFNYVGIGRVAVEHGLNPYAHGLFEVPTDPAFRYATWPDWTPAYGPLATVAFLPLGLFGVPQALWLAKLAAGVAGMGCVGLVAACARELDRPVVPAVLFVGLNPAWLAYGVGGAHVDVLAALLTLCGVWLVLRARGARAGPALAAASAVKVTAAIPLAFAAARRPAVLVAALASLAGLLAAGLALWGTDTFAGLIDQGGASSSRSVPGLVVHVLGGQGVPDALGLAALAAAGAAGCWLLVRTRRGMDWIAAAGWTTVALLLALAWLMPWYLAALLPLAALGDSARLRVAAAALTVFVLAVRLVPLG